MANNVNNLPASETQSPAVCTTACDRFFVRDVINGAAAVFGVSRRDIIGHSRKHPLVRLRQVAMYVAREQTGKSFPLIGQRFGDRHHTTILDGCRDTAARLAAGDSATIEAVATLTNHLLNTAAA